MSDDEDDRPMEETPISTSTPTEARETYHLAYLRSWPLMGKKPTGTDEFPIKKLDFDAEREILKSTLDRTGKEIKVRMEVATAVNLRDVVTEGCRALHYTGHGLKECLAFEDGKGMMHPINPSDLKSLVSAGGGARRIKFVLLSACHSEENGNAFVQAGVPHVIAVKSDSQVQDKSANNFMRALYMSLWSGDTVQAAFDVAVRAVQAAPHQTSLDEHNQFLLLPKGKDHNVKLFDDVKRGRWIDYSPPPVACTKIPSLTDHFQGRNQELQKIIASLRDQKKRLVTIIGEPGIGKSTLAIAAARYCHERSFFDGVFFVALDGYDVGSIAYKCSYAMKISKNGARIVTETCSTVAELAEFLGDDKKYLLVLDGVDSAVHEVKRFIGELLRDCGKVKILATCCENFGACSYATTHIPNYYHEITPLKPADAAQLFWDIAPRQVSLKEFGCSEPKKAGQRLAQHEALKMLGGNPKAIFDAVQLLSKDTKLDDLPEKIREQEAERKKLRELKLTTTPGGKPYSPDSGGEDLETAGGDDSPSQLSPPPFPTPLHNRSGVTRSQTVPITHSPIPSKTTSFILPPVSAPVSASSVPASPVSASPAPVLSALSGDVGQLWTQHFANRPAVSWHEFKPFISDYFVEAAKVYYRPLSEKDLDVIRTKVETNSGGSPCVTQRSFISFWPWFKGSIATIALIRSEWCKDNPRLIRGFISKDQAVNLLREADSPPGTFILRFSDSSAGQIAVVHIEEDTKAPRHSLIFVESERFVMKVDSSHSYNFSTLTELILTCKPWTKLYPGLEKQSAFKQQDEDNDVPH